MTKKKAKVPASAPEDGYSLACAACGKDVLENYMIHHEIWYEALGVRSKKGELHFECVEKRLGRKLTREDFNDAPCNKLPYCGDVEKHLGKKL